MAEGFQRTFHPILTWKKETTKKKEARTRGTTLIQRTKTSAIGTDYKHPWDTLRQEVQDTLSQRYDKQVDKFLKEGCLKRWLRPRLSMPSYPSTEEGCEGCTAVHYLHWFERRLKHDPMNRDVMKTLRRFMEGESSHIELGPQTPLWTDGNFY